MSRNGAPNLIGEIAPRAFIGAAIILYVAAFSWLSIQRHDTYNSTALDLGYYDQAVWNTAQGRLFETSIETDNLLGDHASFNLLCYVPLFWAWPDVRVLLLAQTIVLAVGAVPVALLARRRLHSEWLSAGLSVGYLLYPSTGFINRYDFHPEVMALPAMLFGLWFIDRGEWRPAGLCLILTLLCKEYMGLIVAGYGAYIHLIPDSDENMRRLGKVVLVAGPIWTVAMIGWVMPMFAHGLPANLPLRYLWFLGQNVPDTPRLVFLLFTKAMFLPATLLPLGFLPLLAHTHLAPAVLPLAIVMLSSAPSQATLYFQYMVEFMPPLFASTIYAIENATAQLTRRGESGSAKWLGRLLVVNIIAWTIGYWVFQNPFTFDIPPIYYAVNAPRERSNADSIDAALRLIPSESCVVASNHIAPHLSHRRQIYVLRPLGYNRAPPIDCDYVIADLNENRWGDERQAFLSFMKERNYLTIYDENDVVVALRVN